MAKKISYRAVPIERLTSGALAALLAGVTRLVVAIDVAKLKMMAGFGGEGGDIARLVRFESPMQTRAFVELVVETGRELAVPVEALMEPTGTYGDAVRALLVARGVSVSMLSPKRVHDAPEVFDGVPSLHDAKSCVVMAQLHRQGVSRLYVALGEDRSSLRKGSPAGAERPPRRAGDERGAQGEPAHVEERLRSGSPRPQPLGMATA